MPPPDAVPPPPEDDEPEEVRIQAPARQLGRLGAGEGPRHRRLRGRPDRPGG
jgi:hypothetical protein